MAAVQDDVTIANNATFERFYQILSGGVPQPIPGWVLHQQWRNADGSLALDLTVDSGHLVIVDETIGLWKTFVQPPDLQGLTSVVHDTLAIPPLAPGGVPRTYRPVAGTITIVQGATQASIR